MNSSQTFIFRDKDGIGIPGALIQLKSKEDGFNQFLYTLTEVINEPGVYELNIDEMPFSLYKAWVNTLEEKSFGGLHGRPLGNPFVTFPQKADLEAVNTSLTNSINGVNTSLTNSVSALNTSLAGKAGLSENNNFTGGNTFEQIITIRQPISTDYADPELDSATSNLVTNARLDYKIAHMEGYTESPNFIRVAPGVRAQTGKVYPTINGAVGAFVNPSASNVCKAFIQGMSSTASYIVPSTATPCIKSYVNLIAADRGIVISFPNVNCTEKVTIENATVVLGGGTNRGGSSSARTWVNINFINCRIYHFKNFTLKGGLLENCTVISPDTITFTADKDINDVYTDIIGSTFRVSPSIIDEASYAGAVDYKVTPSLSVIDDFTMESDT